MPQQKGKKKSKRLRRRLGMLGGEGAEAVTVQGSGSGSKPVKRQRSQTGPIMRKGWTPPLWVNAGFGVVLLLMGVVFYLTIGAKTGGGTKIVMLLAYCALGGFYLARALRQYQAKRGQ